MTKKYIVLVQNWREEKEGWGSRPAGFTYHLDTVSRKNYINKYLNTIHLGENPIGKAYLVIVDNRIYNNLKQAQYGTLEGVGWSGPKPATQEEIESIDVDYFK